MFQPNLSMLIDVWELYDQAGIQLKKIKCSHNCDYILIAPSSQKFRRLADLKKDADSSRNSLILMFFKAFQTNNFYTKKAFEIFKPNLHVLFYI